MGTSVVLSGRKAVECLAATTPQLVAAHHKIRHQIFVEEQGLFHPSDVDEHDGRPDVIRVLALCESEPAGAVRLFPLDAGGRRWQGDRLAVLPAFRTQGVGKPLVRFAVATAGALGGADMVAHIQLVNVAFFEQLGWQASGEVETYVGVAHQPMCIGLSRGA
ncbi:MAG: MSMEG_0567/Sll0786 family nitrogen starvation N-acetyltransferase [Acidimicrobiales bacterium]